MLERFLRHFQFLLKSTNQHGVHSPFVYSYLTEGIYRSKKSYKGYQKKRRLLQATIDYFQVKEIYGTPEFQIQMSKCSKKKLRNDTYKRLHYISNINLLSTKELLQLIETADEDTIIYINTPYQSKEGNKKWLEIQTNTKFHVSIDAFLAGMLFTRKEQKKEHFVLRM